MFFSRLGSIHKEEFKQVPRQRFGRTKSTCKLQGRILHALYFRAARPMCQEDTRRHIHRNSIRQNYFHFCSPKALKTGLRVNKSGHYCLGHHVMTYIGSRYLRCACMSVLRLVLAIAPASLPRSASPPPTPSQPLQHHHHWHKIPTLMPQGPMP